MSSCGFCIYCASPHDREVLWESRVIFSPSLLFPGISERKISLWTCQLFHRVYGGLLNALMLVITSHPLPNYRSRNVVQCFEYCCAFYIRGVTPVARYFSTQSQGLLLIDPMPYFSLAHPMDTGSEHNGQNSCLK